VASWHVAVAAILARRVGPRAIFDKLRLEIPPFPGTYSQMKRLCRALRKEKGPRAEDVAIPVETRAGDVAQVDFGYVGKLLDPTSGTRRDAWVFVLVLGFSRRMVTRLVFDQRTPTWLRVHREAFEELGGVPATLVPDNLKAAVVRAAFGVSGPPAALHRSYRDLAQHYGFVIDPAPPRAPRKKGKVEAGVKYVKSSYFQALSATEREHFEGVCRGLAQWTEQVANRRVHGSTSQVPAELFAALEHPALKPLPGRRFDPPTWKQVTVHDDSHVQFEGRRYSAPWRLLGQALWLCATAASVILWHLDERVATHARHGEGPSTQDAHLPQYRVDLRHRDRSFWEQRAEALGPDVASYIREVFEGDKVLSRLRTVQAIVTRLEQVSVERAQATARRAHHFGCHDYAAIKRILQEGLDHEPLPTTPPPTPTALPAPRFARPMSELMHKEESHECHR
jgi:transposase